MCLRMRASSAFRTSDRLFYETLMASTPKQQAFFYLLKSNDTPKIYCCQGFSPCLSSHPSTIILVALGLATGQDSSEEIMDAVLQIICHCAHPASIPTRIFSRNFSHHCRHSVYSRGLSSGYPAGCAPCAPW